MTKIKPFKALRPRRDLVHLVATRPYYSYKKNVLKAKLEDNAFTFIHIINPEFGSIIKTKPNSPERFQLVKNQYDKFIEEGILFEEENETLYVYRQTKNGHQFTGVVAGASVQEYEDDLIKKHEATLTSREAMFTNYLDIVGYNAEPVLMAHPHNEGVDDIINQVIQKRPEYEFTTTDRITHELWVMNSEEKNQTIAAFEQIESCYIADGHHRSASSAALAKLRKDNSNNVNKDFFLTFFIDEKRLKILEFNRLVKGLNGLEEDSFINKLGESFTVSKIENTQKPSKEHDITMCLRGKWYLLSCKENIIDKKHPVKSIDPEILTEFVLSPVLGITDLKTDQNIEFVSGAESLSSIEEKIIKGKFDVAFILYPVTMEQVMRVADHQMIMPPKSTWVEPKLRSGLTIYNINE